MMLDAVVTEVEKLMANPDLTDAEKEALEAALDALKSKRCGQMPDQK